MTDDEDVYLEYGHPLEWALPPFSFARVFGKVKKIHNSKVGFHNWHMLAVGGHTLKVSYTLKGNEGRMMLEGCFAKMLIYGSALTLTLRIRHRSHARLNLFRSEAFSEVAGIKHSDSSATGAML